MHMQTYADTSYLLTPRLQHNPASTMNPTQSSMIQPPSWHLKKRVASGAAPELAQHSNNPERLLRIPPVWSTESTIDLHMTCATSSAAKLWRNCGTKDKGLRTQESGTKSLKKNKMPKPAAVQPGCVGDRVRLRMRTRPRPLSSLFLLILLNHRSRLSFVAFLVVSE